MPEEHDAGERTHWGRLLRLAKNPDFTHRHVNERKRLVSTAMIYPIILEQLGNVPWGG